MILEHLYFVSLADYLSRFPIVPTLARILFPSTLVTRNRNSEYARALVSKRLEKKTPRKDFITTLVSKVESGEVEKEELTAHCSTIAVAGGESTSTASSSTLFFLLKDQQAHHRLVREIRARFENYEDIDATGAQQLPYLQAVINEGMRLHPPGSQGFPRISPGTTVDGRWIPQGTEVYTSPWAVTHDPANFKDPMFFTPERWLDPESTDIKEASQPFSLGPRGCIGRNFAMMQMNLLMAKMLWTYDLELLNPEIDWEGNSRMYFMWWKPKAMVRFLPRTDL